MSYSEPIGEKRTTSILETQSYTNNELDLLAEDIDQLLHFLLYHPERSQIKAGKKEEFDYESRSPFLLELLQARDWDALAYEIAINGASIQEISILTDAVIELIFFGDFRSTDQLFSQLRLQQVSRSCHIVTPSKEFIDPKLLLSSIAQNVALLVFDDDLTVEYRRSKLSEYLDQRDACIASQSKSIFEDLQRNGYLKKRLVGQGLQTSNQELHSQFHQFLHRRIASEIRKAISSFNCSSAVFPNLSSHAFSHITERNLSEQYSEVVENVRNNLLAQYHSSGTEATHAIRVLSHLDPELALVEVAADPQTRSELVEEIMSSEPSLSRHLTDRGLISQSEIDHVGGYAQVNPNYFLLYYTELDSTESELEAMLFDAILRVPIDRILSISQTDQRIVQLILAKSELRQHVLGQLTSIILQAPVPLTAITIIGSSRLGDLEGLQEVYLSLIEKEVLALRAELLSKFDLHSQKVIDDIMGFGDIHSQYFQIIKQRLSHFPSEIQYAISLAAICCPGQSCEISEEISESVYSCVFGYESRNKLSKPLRRTVATSILRSWGTTIETIFLLLQTGFVSVLNREQQEQVDHFISSVIDKHLQQEPDFGSDDYWSENRIIALYIDTSFATFDSVIKDKIARLLEKDSELLDLVLTYESERPQGYTDLISDQLAERIVLAKSDVKAKLEYLILFATGRSEGFVTLIFQEIQRRHPVMTVVSSLNQYQRLITIFSTLPINSENLAMALEIESRCTHADRRYVAEFGFSTSGAFEKQAASLWVSKFLQSNGISEADSIGWAARVCRKYQDRNYDSLLDEQLRLTYEKIDIHLNSHKLELAQFILDHPSVNWEIGAPRLIDLIIGNTPFGIRNFLNIFSFKLNLSPKQELILHQLFNLKDLRQGRLARRSIICGLLELSNDQRGKEAIGNLLESSDLSKADPKRLRTILRMKSLVDVPELLSQNQGKLVHIREAVMNKVSDVISAEVGTLSVDRTALSVNIEYFISSGFMGAYVALSKRYSQLEDPRSLNVLRQALGQMLAGNFIDWRDSHEISVQQLSIVGEEVASTWKVAQEKEQIEAVPESVRSLAKTVRSSIFDVVMHLPFNSHTVESELSNCLAKIETLPGNLLLKDQHQRLSRKKEIIDLINKIRKYDLSVYSKDNLIHLIRLLFHQLEDQSATQSAQDVGELLRLLTLTETFQAGEILTASDTDDPIQLVNSGVFPRETCQSWRQGIYNECLVSTLSDANTRLLVVVDSEGQVVGRTLMKLLPLQTGPGKEFPAVVLERIYTLRDNAAIEKVILKAALKKATACGLPLVFSDYVLTELLENDPEFASILSESSELQLANVKLTGEFGYSDLFGGRLINGGGLKEPSPVQKVMPKETKLAPNADIEIRGELTEEQLSECNQLKEVMEQLDTIKVRAFGVTANMVVYMGTPGPCIWFTVGDSPYEYKVSVAKNTFRGRPNVVVSNYPFHNHPEVGAEHTGPTLDLLVLTKVRIDSPSA